MILVLAAAAAVAAASATPAPAAPNTATMAYGAPITPAQADAFMAAAAAEARRLSAPVSIALVEPSGELVAFRRGEGTNYATSEVVIQKAKAAARFKRPTSYWGQVVASGSMFPLTLPGMILSGGGVPVVKDGRIIGGVGVGGGTGAQDEQVAQAGMAALP